MNLCTHYFKFKGFIDACDKSVIPYSRTYDNCVTRKTSVDGKTCPPGPFSCSKSPKTIQAWTEARETNIITLRDCFKYMPRKDKCKVGLIYPITFKNFVLKKSL